MEQKNHKMLEKALQILAFVADRPEGATLTQVCSTLQMPKSSAYNLLITYEHMGYLNRDPASGIFTIGLRAYEIGSKFVENNDFYRYSRDVLEELVKDTGETAHLATLEDSDVVYINKFDCSHAVRMISTIGKRIPAHATAIGKALLSGQKDQQIRALYGQGELSRLTEHTVCDLEELLRQIRQVRATGFAMEQEESTPGVRCIAAPIHNRANQVVAAISIAVPLSRSGDTLDRFQSPLLKARQRLQAVI